MRKIIHVDMDCFYAAVEMRENPKLHGRPLAVGGSRERRGVISTCNYEARAFGVRSAMPTHQALQLCPELILVPGNMNLYKEISLQIRRIFQRYTSIIEPLSLDEAYLDVSECPHLKGSATLIAENIRREIKAVTGLTASAGVAPNKFLAKIASDENKPDGLCVITPDSVGDFVRALPLRKIPGVGKKTQQKLKEFGLETCLDVQQLSEADMVTLLGKFGRALHKRSFGIDERALETERERKSVGIETTFSRDLTQRLACDPVLDELIPKLEHRLAPYLKEQAPKSHKVKLKFADFTQTTVEHASSEYKPEVFNALLDEAWARGQGKAVRLVGIGIGLTQKQQSKQISFSW